MHAAVVRVTINDPEAATSHLREEVVPEVSQIPGFVSGYWTRKDNTGLSMMVFESEDAVARFNEAMASIPREVGIEQPPDFFPAHTFVTRQAIR